MSNDIPMTLTEKARLEVELARLRSEEMPALAERIREARALGDLSENFDYQDAKRQQGFVAGRISDLQAMLDRAEIITEAIPGSGIIGVGSKIALRDVDFNDTFDVVLVGQGTGQDGDYTTINSPLGAAIDGKKVGDTVTYTSPSGKTTVEILSVE